jgi:hypothetical protein
VQEGKAVRKGRNMKEKGRRKRGGQNEGIEG